ncbi:MAG: hypothetical protein KFH98_09295 [Gemmatimonadetes bacterium]|nr:hypothetical protein [Gemmatimonadota bacterium]
MVSLMSLMIPIVVSAVLVFIASSIIHMFLGYHANDFVAVPDEDAVRRALSTVPPGEYGVPYAGSMAAMKSAEFTEKMKAGPVVLMTVSPGAAPTMSRELTLWFVFCLVVSIFAGYVAGRALPLGADYLDVFRFAGTTAFAGYALAQWQNTIWYRRSAMTSLKNTFDGLIYALITAGVFGWLWPS